MDYNAHIVGLASCTIGCGWQVRSGYDEVVGSRVRKGFPGGRECRGGRLAERSFRCCREILRCHDALPAVGGQEVGRYLTCCSLTRVRYVQRSS